MKIYQVKVVDGIYTVPELKLDWDSILSNKTLWAKYNSVLLRFYYSPNHGGTCQDVALEFNDNASSLNAHIRNFGREVVLQNANGDFVVMQENKVQFWIISMNGYNDGNKGFVWQLRPDLTDAIKRKLKSEAELKEKFLERFPVESLRSMPIEKYTNLNRNDSFCYWLESETYWLGSIYGGNASKFGIYRYNKDPKESMPVLHDENYCWLSKLNCETSEEAYENVKDKIATIAEKSAAGDLRGVDEVDFGDVVKWKIACLYSDNKVINLYTNKLLQAAAKGFGYTGDLNSRPAMNEFITAQYDKSRESFHDFYMRVGIHYFGKNDPEKMYWLVEHTYGSTGSQLQRFLSDGVWESKLDDGNVNDQKMIPLALAQSISEGDVIILTTKGSRHDQSFMRIKAVGVVTSNITTYRNGNSTMCQCSVKYISTEEKDFDGVKSGQYLKSIHKSDRNLNEVIEYVNNLISGEVMPMSKIKQENKNKYQEYIDMLQQVHNLVLTGSPGTGKTFLAKAIAENMEAEWEFVQFHPSYDYTDFVEGLRPTGDSGNFGFELRNGIFKDFCAKALQNLIDSKKSLQALQQENSVRDILDGFLEDAIEYGTTFKTSGTKNVFHVIENKERTIIVEVPANEKTSMVKLPKADLLTLLENKVEISGGKDIQEYFKRKHRTQQDSYVYVLYNLVKKYDPKKKTADVSLIKLKNYVFIIDEINRGDISKIFGELFFSIDPGYRGEKGRVKTQYQNMLEDGDVFKDGFFVPENVYIIGTMNDIDRSVESMDFAMRRRFTWKEVTPSETDDMLNELSCANEAKKTMSRLNKSICNTDGLGTAYMIGPSYFLKLKDYGGDFNKLWEMNIEPLLKEYLRGFRKRPEILEQFRKEYFNESNTPTTDIPNLVDED